MSGKKVFSKDVNRKQDDINLSNLSSGTYILNAKVSGGNKSFKIIKK